MIARDKEVNRVCKNCGALTCYIVCPNCNCFYMNDSGDKYATQRELAVETIDTINSDLYQELAKIELAEMARTLAEAVILILDDRKED